MSKVFDKQHVATVVTVSFNSADTILDTLNSVRAQNVPIEHVIVDGASSDGTTNIVEECSSASTRLISEPDLGSYDAINKGLRLATGDVVGLLHADDVYADERVIEDVMNVFENPEIEAVYGDLNYVDRIDGHTVKRKWRAGEFSLNRLRAGWMPPHPTFFVRREYYEKHGLYRLDLGTSADYELMLRFLLVHKIRVKYIPRVLVKMRVGGASSASLGARLRANRMDRKAWKVNGLMPYPWTMIAKPLRKLGQWYLR